MTEIAKPRAQTKRYLGLDLSLSPGLAVIDVKERIPTLVYAGSVATDTDINDATRSVVVESFIAHQVYAHLPFDVILREDFTSGRNKRSTQTVFNAWASADRALHSFGYKVHEVEPVLAPTSVKKLVAGNGKAEKKDVAEGVRKYLRLPSDYKFASGYDDSDAAAVVLAYLIRENLIDTEVAAA